MSSVVYRCHPPSTIAPSKSKLLTVVAVLFPDLPKNDGRDIDRDTSVLVPSVGIGREAGGKSRILFGGGDGERGGDSGIGSVRMIPGTSIDPCLGFSEKNSPS